MKPIPLKLQVSIGLGGWNDSQGNKYGPLLTNPALRSAFVTAARDFLKQHNFDGLELDLEVSRADCKLYKNRTILQ